MNESLANVYAVAAALQSALANAVNAATTPVSDVAGTIRTQLGSAVAAATPTVLDIGAQIAAAITIFGQQFTGALTTPDDFWKPVKDLLGVGGIGDSLQLGTILSGALAKSGKDLQDAVKRELALGTAGTATSFANLLAVAGDLDSTPEDIRNAIRAFSDLAKAGNTGNQFWITLLGAIVFIKSGLDALTEGRTRALQLTSNATFTPERLSADQAADAYIKDIPDPDRIEASYKAAGLSKDYFDLLVRLRQWYPDAASLVIQNRFGHIDDETFTNWITKAGVPGDRQELLKDLLRYVPTPADVVSWFTRDAFYPDIVETFGLDLDYPPDANEWFDRIGVDRDTARNIWRAHWELPSTQLAFEMFQRIGQDGTPIIGINDLNRLMRAQGIEPFWRDKILEVSYNPITRVDIRRLNKTGVIKEHDQLVNLYRNVGYSPSNAELLAQFTEKLNGDELGADKKSAMADAAQEVQDSLAAGTIDEGTAHSLLVTSGYTSEHATVLVHKAGLTETKRIRTAVLGGVKREYVASLITAEAATAALIARGWSAERATAIVDSWRYDRDYADKSASRQRRHTVTESQVLAAYDEGVLDQAAVRGALSQLGVPEADQSLLLSLADAKRAASVRKHRAAAVLKEYQAKALGREEAAAQLQALGVPAEAAGADLDTVDAQREAKRPELPLNLLEKLALDKLVPADELVADLRRRGYSDTQISWLGALWGYDLAQLVEKEATKAGKAKERTEKQKAADQVRRQKLIVKNVLAKLRRGEITRQQAIDAIANAGVPIDEATLQVDTVVGSGSGTPGAGTSSGSPAGVSVTVTPVNPNEGIHGLPFEGA